jgi:uncharacterized protein
MVATIDFSNFTYPGVRVVESSDGYRILDLASFSTVYLFGSSTSGSYEPTLCTSYNEFLNLFPGSLSDPYVRVLLESSNLSNSATNALYFVRVGIASTFRVTLLNATPGTVALTINGQNISTVIQSGDTITETITTLITLINQNVNISGDLSALPGETSDSLLVVSDSFSTPITISGNTPNTNVVEQTSLTPRATDYAQAILNAFSIYEIWPQGFVIAPEAFATFDDEDDRQIVGRAMETLASASNFDWFSVIDVGEDVITTQQLLDERALYSSPQGHSAIFAPWVRTLYNQLIPASPVVVNEALRAIKQSGTKRAFAGTEFALTTVQSLETKYNDTQQGILNPQGVNLIRELRNLGTVIWGARTLATDTNYVQIPGRLTMNSINGTIRQVPGLYNFVFEPLESNGELLIRLKESLDSIMRRFYKAGALFGETEEQAFFVKCDFENNSADEMNLGNVYAAVYAATTPYAEKILINTIKVPIGQVPTV